MDDADLLELAVEELVVVAVAALVVDLDWGLLLRVLIFLLLRMSLRKACGTTEVDAVAVDDESLPVLDLD